MTAYVQGKVWQCDCQKQHKSIILSNLKYIKYPFTKTDNLNLRAMSVIRKEQVNKKRVISQIQPKLLGHREPFLFIKIGIMHAN